RSWDAACELPENRDRDRKTGAADRLWANGAIKRLRPTALRHHDQVHVVGHEAIGPHRDAGRSATLGQDVAEERVVALLEEHPLAAVTPLRHMVREAGNNDAAKA